MTVNEIVPGDGPVADVGDDAAVARAAMDTHHVDWFGVCESGRLLGWLWGHELNGRVSAEGVRPFRSVVRPDTTLRSALDGIVNSLTNVAVVEDVDGRYRGMVRVEEISEGVRR